MSKRASSLGSRVLPLVAALPLALLSASARAQTAPVDDRLAPSPPPPPAPPAPAAPAPRDPYRWGPPAPEPVLPLPAIPTAGPRRPPRRGPRGLRRPGAASAPAAAPAGPLLGPEPHGPPARRRGLPALPVVARGVGRRPRGGVRPRPPRPPRQRRRRRRAPRHQQRARLLAPGQGPGVARVGLGVRDRARALVDHPGRAALRRAVGRGQREHGEARGWQPGPRGQEAVGGLRHRRRGPAPLDGGAAPADRLVGAGGGLRPPCQGWPLGGASAPRSPWRRPCRATRRWRRTRSRSSPCASGRSIRCTRSCASGSSSLVES